MSVEFTKMHGLGNDFVVIDALSQTISLDSAQARLIADRHFGVGCDQLLLVEKARGTEAEFRYRIFNADGGEVEQCGNGARCFALFVRQQGLTSNDNIVVETAAGLIELRVHGDQVTVDMGVPVFEPDKLPFSAEKRADTYDLVADGEEYAIGAVSMGNPHAVLQVDDIDTIDVDRIGHAIENHPRFPQRVNVGFMQVVDRHRIRLRVYERGAAETLACGTGACAAVAIGRLYGLLDEEVSVTLRGGELTIHWPGEGQALLMTGPATTVFHGKFDGGIPDGNATSITGDTQL